MVKDFNEMLERIIFRPQSSHPPLIIFSLSDIEEQAPSFAGRVFSKRIVEKMGSLIRVLKVNPPTEKIILEVLERIAANEHLSV